MKTYLIIINVVFVFVVFVFNSCSNSDKSKIETKQTVVEKVLKEQDLKPDIRKILYEFPTPFEVTVMLNKAKAAFIFDLTNPVANLSKYETENLRAIFLGVYSADLSYAAAYNMADEMEALLKCTSDLTDKLGISGIYDENLVHDIKRNYNNQDSLVTIISNAFGQTKEFLAKADRDKTSFLIASGGFIETLYVASSLNLLAENNNEISTIILNQYENLKKLSSVISMLSEDEEIGKLNSDFKKLEEVFKLLRVDEGKGLDEEQAGKLKDVLETIRGHLDV